MSTRVIKKLILKKNGRYEVVLEDKTIELDEDIILKYRLFEGKELACEEKILEEDMRKKYFNMALKYQLRYGKTSNEVIAYLMDKELNRSLATNIVEELIEKKFLNDEELAISIASSLARSSNGPLMIREKLKLRRLSAELIEKAISSISKDDYELGVSKLYKKGSKQYAKSLYVKQKLRELFFRRGYVDIPDFLELESK